MIPAYIIYYEFVRTAEDSNTRINSAGSVPDGLMWLNTTLNVLELSRNRPTRDCYLNPWSPPLIVRTISDVLRRFADTH